MFKLTPALKDYLWGGTLLKEHYGKETELPIVAESWELSTHPDGESIISTGENKGKTLSAYIKEYGVSVLGTNCWTEQDVPILIKLIDAKQNLSIQVHPDNEYALTNEGDYGKTEMWYIVEAAEGSQLVCGLTEDLTREEFEKAIKQETLPSYLKYIPVKKGDVLFIPPGTIHAIGEGVIIAEVQQRSNVTYRIFDYGRIGADGKKRELHVDKALDVSNLTAYSSDKLVSYQFTSTENSSVAKVVDCDYFKVAVGYIHGSVSSEVDNSSFETITVLAGRGHISSETASLTLATGDTVFMPASFGSYTIEGVMEIISTKL